MRGYDRLIRVANQRSAADHGCEIQSRCGIICILLYSLLPLFWDLPQDVDERHSHITSSTKFPQAPADLGGEYCSDPFIL